MKVQTRNFTRKSEVAFEVARNSKLWKKPRVSGETRKRGSRRRMCFQVLDATAVIDGNVVGTLFSMRQSGGENPKVREHRGVIVFELDVYPEPKVLSQIDLQRLFEEYGAIEAVARSTGLAWSTVPAKLKPARKWDPKKKVFVRLKSTLK